MEFSTLSQSVQDAWDFCWRPTLNVLVMAAIAVFLSPRSAHWIGSRAKVGFAAFRSFCDPRLEYLGKIGVLKLAPFAILFAAAFALFLFQEAVLTVGYLLPGHVTSHVPSQFYRQLPNEDIAQIWARYPSAKNVSELAVTVNRRIDSVRPDRLMTSARGWTDDGKFAYLWTSTAKVWAAWTIIWTVVALWNSFALKTLAKCIAILAVTFLMAAWGVSHQLYAKDKENQLRAAAAYVVIVAQDVREEQPADEVMAAYVRRLEEAEESGEVSSLDWWDFTPLDSGYWGELYGIVTETE
jgi:hypothetical protein